MGVGQFSHALFREMIDRSFKKSEEAVLGSLNLEGEVLGSVHHIATNKNFLSAVRGGPWTQRFAAIFEKAGVDLNSEINTVRIEGHAGPHPEAYHRAVFDRLVTAVDGLEGASYTKALEAELSALKAELNSAESELRKLVTRTPQP